MPQSRVRKAPGGGGSDAGKTRASAAKASGDNAPSGRTKEHNQNNSKNKIPKKIQYDLDNALVGLCDVWFEEIKPHLLRNNIKLHVEGAGPAGGDHHCLPAEAPGCSHDDPASTANECELCRLLFNAANSIESAVSQAASAASSTGLASAASELASNASHTRSDVSE